ncbi:MAG: glycosyltransferase family 4 protein [Sphingomonas bacterium]
MSLAAPLREQGKLVHILGNRSLHAIGDLSGCEPAFALRCEETPLIPGLDPLSAAGIEQIRQRRNDLLVADLNRIARTHQLTDADVLLINSLRHWSLEAIVEWLEKLDSENMPTVVLVLHYTAFPHPGVAGATARAYRDAFVRIKGSIVARKIILCTDSERLAEEYRSLADISITVLPIPHRPPARLVEHDIGAELTIAFAGEARKDKGFLLLPQVIRDVMAQETARKIVFRLQAYCADRGEEACRLARADLPACSAIEILSEPLDEAQYEQFIAQADLILIPYLREAYHAQTSGVYCEAAALGTPVVVPEGTWMADQLVRNGGGVVFESGNAVSLASACLEAIRNYPALREQALSAAPDWRAFHDPENFVSELERAIRHTRSTTPN